MATSYGLIVETLESPDRRRGNLCRCSVCGVASLCTPASDFWVPAGSPIGTPLECESCMKKRLKSQGLKWLDNTGINQG